MQYSLQHFITKFEAIPEHLFVAYTQGEEEPEPTGPHCAIGWCKNSYGLFGNAHAGNSGEAKALFNLFLNAGIVIFTQSVDGIGWNVADVNNGRHPSYPQPTPKQRILAALYDIRKMQHRVVYVAVDASVRNQVVDSLINVQ